MHDRRAFLALSGSTAAALLLAADADEVRAALAYARSAAMVRPAPPWEYLTAEQAADVEAIASQIIPSDDGPGAREAGVVYFMDRALATWAKDQRAPFAAGLDTFNAEAAKRWPGTTRFAALSPLHQVELLQASEKTPFFRIMRQTAVVGFLSDPSLGGNRDKIGWKHIGFDDRFQWQPPFGDYDRAAMEGK